MYWTYTWKLKLIQESCLWFWRCQQYNESFLFKSVRVTLQSNHRFNAHIKVKLQEAYKCLYVIRCLHIEGYQQPEVDYVFRAIVLSKLTYGLPVCASSMPELTTVQNVLQPCLKGKYTSHQIDIYSVLEQVNRSLFKKISSMPDHPLYPYVPETKKSSARLRVLFLNSLFFLSNIE